MYRIFLVLIASTLLVGCPPGEEPAAVDAGHDASPDMAVGNTFELRITPGFKRLARYETLRLEAQVYRNGEPIDTPAEEIVWTYDDRFIEHRGLGVFYAHTLGESDITATFGNITGRAAIDVTYARVASIRILPDDLVTLRMGDTYDYTYILYGSDGRALSTDEPGVVRFSTTDERIATVSDQGRVTGEYPGTTEVVVESQGITASAPLEVQGPQASRFEIYGVPSTLIRGEPHHVGVALEWSDPPLQSYTQRTSLSNVSVVRFGLPGEVYGQIEGRATVTVSIDEYPYIRTSLDITVTNKVDDFVIVDETSLMALVDGRVFRRDGDYFYGLTDEVDEFASLEGGFGHYCMLNADSGSVACAGENRSGQAGVPSQYELPNPRYLAETGAESIVVDGNRSCFKRAGNTHCWGRINNSAAGTATPTPVAYTAFAQSEGHTCDVTPTGLSCYGNNDQGQLGLGTITPVGAGTVVTTETFVELAAGESFTCGLNASGAAFCWGDGDDGQLGNGQFADTNTPQPVSGAHQFTSLAAGGRHVCGLDTSGSAWCWGNNEEGQLGDGTSESRAVPTAVDTMLTFTKIDTSTAISCALETVHHNIWCWGGRTWRSWTPRGKALVGYYRDYLP